MKILYVIPNGEDLGGIINSSEHLMQGFREAGHEATFCLLTAPQSEVKTYRAAGDTSDYPRAKWQDSKTWVRSPHTGQWVHPVHGWKGPWISMVAGIDKFLRLASQHDVIVWGALFGLRNKHTEGNSRWIRFFSDTAKPTVVMVRDDHLQTRYPWIVALAPWITAWVGVQRVSYDICAGIGRRAIVYSGHDVSPVDIDETQRRPARLFSCQTFKRWKRADRLIAAAPHLTKLGVQIDLAGDGIELRYMRSKEKVRLAYVCSLKNDPDAWPALIGKPIWDNAVASQGFYYEGAVSESKRNEALLEASFFVDLSERPHSTGQINRSVVEAIRHGVIPMATPQFISGNPEGQGELFVANEHYVPVRTDYTPAQLAHFIKSVTGMPEKERQRMRDAGQQLIRRFDRHIAAEQLVRLASGESIGWDYSEDPVDERLMARGRAMFREMFGEIK